MRSRYYVWPAGGKPRVSTGDGGHVRRRCGVQIAFLGFALAAACDRHEVTVDVSNKSVRGAARVELILSGKVVQSGEIAGGSSRLFQQKVVEDGSLGVKVTYGDGSHLDNPGTYVTPNMSMALRFAIFDDRIDMLSSP